jgi:DNA-binding NtrC family response regulator
MLVDDEEKVLAAFSRVLNKENYNLVTVRSGAAALARMAEQPADVVVTDQQMPGMTGLELLKHMKEEYPHTIRIVLTGHADIAVAVAAINEGGVYQFITKPVRAEELKLAIRHALMHHDLLCENKKLLQEIGMRDRVLGELESEYPGIGRKRISQGGALVIEAGGLSLDELILRYFPQ